MDVATCTSCPQVQKGVRPGMFKTLIGRGHAEFSTNRQQDASEFLLHLLSSIQRSDRALAGSDSQSLISLFQFQVPVSSHCISTLFKFHFSISDIYHFEVQFQQLLHFHFYFIFQFQFYTCTTCQVEERIQCMESGQVRYTQREDTIWQLPVAIDTATNKSTLRYAVTLLCVCVCVCVCDV